MDTIAMLIDEAAGIYIPRKFYENFDFGTWNVDLSEYLDLSDPDKEHYWDAWDDLLANARYTDDEGREWTLWQDGSLFAVRADHEFDDDNAD